MRITLFRYLRLGEFSLCDRAQVVSQSILHLSYFHSEMVNDRPPKSIAGRDYNIVHWAELPKSGHFAALKQPE
jgi:hypothetical protein